MLLQDIFERIVVGLACCGEAIVSGNRNLLYGNSTKTT